MKSVREARKLLKERLAVPLEGRNLVLDSLRWGLRPIYLFMTKEEPSLVAEAERRGIKPIFISEKNMARLSSLKTPPGELLLVEPPSWEEGNFRKIVVLETVQDPTNVGSILRTAYCLGYDAVYTDIVSAHPFSPKTVRASAGYSLKIPVFRTELREKILGWKGKFSIVGTFPSAGQPPEKISLPFAVVFGNESRGISPQIFRLMDRKISLPMQRGESLGVASAAAIILYLLKG